MNSETPDKTLYLRISRLWIWGTGIAALVGAGLAVTLFPSAAFGRNPTGQFDWKLVGFALAIGIPFAVSQWLTLRFVPRYRKTANISFLVLWIPITSIGITLMMLPLWWTDAVVFFVAPWTAAIVMLPGMIFLGLGQWLVLYRVITARIIWVLRTIAGAAIGAVLGLVVAFGFSFLSLPLEATWAFVLGASIGALQRSALASDLDTDLRRREQPS